MILSFLKVGMNIALSEAFISHVSNKANRRDALLGTVKSYVSLEKLFTLCLA